jgi:hypothetical protein
MNSGALYGLSGPFGVLRVVTVPPHQRQAGPKARLHFRTARPDPNPIPATKSPANQSPAMPAFPMIR